jgi:hypothetical protein
MFTTASSTSSTNHLILLYTGLALPMLGGLLHGRAPLSRLLLWPLSSAFFAAVISAILGLLHNALAPSMTTGQTHLLTGASLLAIPLLGYVLGRLAARTTPAQVHQRGTRVIDGGSVQRATRKLLRAHPDRITLAGLAVDPLDETKHFKLLGTTGSGKSTAIREVLRTALSRGDRALIADPDGGYLQRFYNPDRGDVILNPFDPRSARWDLFGELRDPYDADQLARALIPDAADASGREWRAYARTFVAALLRPAGCTGAPPTWGAPPTSISPDASNRPSRFSHTPNGSLFSWSDSSIASYRSAPPSPSSRGSPARDLAELWRRLAIATADELRPLVHNTPAQPFLENENARMFGSIRSVTTSALAGLEHVASQRAGTPISIRSWIRPSDRLLSSAVSAGRELPTGVIFMPYAAGQIASLRGLIATWVRLAIFEAMNGPEGDQRLWFVIDELDALGAIDGLKDALARLRKFGGRCVLGFQSIGQVSALYGRGDAQTIVENCGNTLILRCSASEGGGTALFASQLIGQREVLRRHVSRTDARDGTSVFSRRRRSTTESDQVVTEPAVLPAEIEQLPDLAGYVKTASTPTWYRMRFPSDAPR